MHRIRDALVVSTAVFVVMADGRPLAAQSPAPDRNAESLITPATEEAINRGLEYLSRQQGETDAADGSVGFEKNVAVSALAGLALLSSGSLPGRGPYGCQIERIESFICSRARPDGFILTPEGKRSSGPMYEHGFSTLFLAEMHGVSRRDDLRDVLAAAVELILRTQNREGGWRYDPKPSEADISVTVCQINALRAARSVGIAVPAGVIDKAVAYIRECHNDDGGFRYRLQDPPTSAFGRSAAALVGLHNAGIHDEPIVEDGRRFLWRYIAGDGRAPESYYYYSHFYAALAMWFAGDEQWRPWYAAIRDELLARQYEDGSWNSESFGREYATAMALLVMQLPNDVVPAFQR